MAKKDKNAFTLIEVVVTAGLLAALSLAGAMTLGSFHKATKKARDLGIKEDFRNYARERIDCVQTARREHTSCDTGTPIKGYDRFGREIVSNTSSGRRFGDHDMKLTCSKFNDVSMQIDVEIKKATDTGFQRITEVPIVCEGLCGMPVWASPMTDPGTFPPPPISPDPYAILGAVKQKLQNCGLPILGGNKPIRRSWGASKRGKDRPFTQGTEDTATLKRVCQLLGYSNYVSSRCEQPRDSSRCNFTSPGDNYLVHFNGTSDRWVHPGPSGYNLSWISQITCSGYTGAPILDPNAP